ncbi:MAG: T9SS type A sorting domain-containing protein [Ignavibacteria bacterium]|nr:T9SS type A sorting domain-containing protein [Ignavibacteria bacterium]
MKRYILLAILFVIASAASAQWTSNTSVNTKVCDTTGEQTLCKIALTSDGGCYIGWFDQRSGSYAVYLQRLNPQGYLQFPADGLLISNNPQSSSLVDWSLAVDDSDCCVLAFTDTRAGSSINPYAYRINPAGQFLWGANGIALTDSSAVYQANPKVIPTSDGNVVIAWQYNNNNAMQKLNKAGVKQWGSAPIKIYGNLSIGEKFNYPTGVASDNGSVILYWIGYTGSFISPSNFKTYTQKYSSAGTGLWGNPQDTLFNLGQAQGTYQPSIYSDGNNGAIYVWQSYVAGPTNCYVQRKNSAGQIQFPVNGATVGVVNSNLRFAPSAAYMPSTGETYVFWQEKNSLQSMIGVYGQKFSSNGTRLWPDAGQVIKPMDGNSFNGLATIIKDTSIYVYYNEIASVNGTIKACKMNRDGVLQWGGSIITPASATSAKGRLGAVMTSTGMSILAFTDSKVDANGIYAQNINPNGSFGPPTGIIPINTTTPGTFSLNQNYPNPFNPSTEISYSIKENSFVTLKVYNILGKEIAALVNQNQKQGAYTVSFKTSNLSSGIYFYKLTAGSFVDTKTMMLIK